MSSTIDYYNIHARDFSDSTINVEFTHMQDHFLDLLPSGALILDFGCGSGRDTRYFLDKGYKVEAIDGSVELCQIASEYTGITVKHMYFEELDAQEKYDGIWACSSILHLDRESLADVMFRIVSALKPGGIIYTSFKYGDYEGMRSGRYFIDFTEKSFSAFLDKLACKEIFVEEQWITADARPGRSGERWLNIILRKSKNNQSIRKEHKNE